MTTTGRQRGKVSFLGKTGIEARQRLAQTPFHDPITITGPARAVWAGKQAM